MIPNHYFQFTKKPKFPQEILSPESEEEEEEEKEARSNSSIVARFYEGFESRYLKYEGNHGHYVVKRNEKTEKNEEMKARGSLSPLGESSKGLSHRKVLLRLLFRCVEP
uniref:Uncharacterized protein n=1 Tax=Solanum tuberosum TaxID=4113 RepID=M1DL20_SOLTU